MPESLFGHLAHNFSAHPENLATEALAFILNRSHCARMAFTRLIAGQDRTISPDLRFVTQAAGPDGAIPDLVGLTEDNQPAIIIESKFWAGLTDHQPVTYLNRLIEIQNGVLVIIAPAKRFSTLHPELVRRCCNAQFPAVPLKSENDECLRIQVGRGIMLLICSWRLVLNAMRYQLEEIGELDAVADVRQLMGFCEQMDSEGFLPLRSKELSSTVGSRNVQYCEIVDHVTDLLVSEGIASIKGLRKTPKIDGYGRYMLIMNHYGCMLQFNSWYWKKFRETPIWLSIKDASAKDADWSYSHKARTALHSLEMEMPPRLIEYEQTLLVPLFLPIAKEHADVIASIRAQLDEVFSALKTTVSGNSADN